MAPVIINNDTVQGETFLPGQIFVFGCFALRANSLGHLEQIESYAPGQIMVSKVGMRTTKKFKSHPPPTW